MRRRERKRQKEYTERDELLGATEYRDRQRDRRRERIQRRE